MAWSLDRPCQLDLVLILFLSEKEKENSFSECWLCSSCCSQPFSLVVSFKCLDHSTHQIWWCLFLRWTTKRRLRKVHSICPGYSASNYWGRMGTQHFLTPKPMFFALYSKMSTHFSASGSWPESIRQRTKWKALLVEVRSSWNSEARLPGMGHHKGILLLHSPGECYWGMLTWKHSESRYYIDGTIHNHCICCIESTNYPGLLGLASSLH